MSLTRKFARRWRGGVPEVFRSRYLGKSSPEVLFFEVL
jgi:hypothetical protein